MSHLEPIFARNKFLLRQKHLTLGAEKYHVWDEAGETLLYVERPRHTIHNILAMMGGLIAGAVVFGLFCMMGSLIPATDQPALQLLQAALFLVGGMGGVAAYVAGGVLLSRKRHVTFYRDEAKQEEPALIILQDQKFAFPTMTFTVQDGAGEPLAKVAKNYLYDLVRKRWRCHTPDGQPICLVQEDQWFKAILRRIIGNFFGLLRTNFVFLTAAQGQMLGAFNRQLTILDRYVLDLSPDEARQLDRRIALAIGVLLDTAERR